MNTNFVVEIGIFTDHNIDRSKRINLDFKSGKIFSIEVLDYGIDWLRFYQMEAKELELILIDLLELKWEHKISIKIKKSHYGRFHEVLDKFSGKGELLLSYKE